MLYLAGNKFNGTAKKHAATSKTFPKAITGVKIEPITIAFI